MDLKKELIHPDNYINREFSALAFNQHVLMQANDKTLPLLERLRFLYIVSSNLDEFFEVRVAGIKEKIALNSTRLSIDGLTPSQVFERISESAHLLSDKIYSIYNHLLLPQLAKEDIHFLSEKQWNDVLLKWAKKIFKDEILPVVSPIGLDLAHPFPRLVNKSLNFIVSLSGKDAFGRSIEYAIVHAPRSLPRAIRVPSSIIKEGYNFIYLKSIITKYAHYLFPGMEINGCHAFRLTRNSDLFLHEEEIEDLAAALQTELFSRHYGHVVRLEIDKKCPKETVEFLLQKHHLNHTDAYYCDGPVNLTRYMAITEIVDRADLKYPEFMPSCKYNTKNIFKEINNGDIILHHPYESFNTVVDFVKQAASDSNVLAIKQTLYRTHSNSVMVKALVDAARSGKEVTAVIELRARFDEESNLKLANDLEQAGALVLFGVVGFKTHAKMTLVVRRENGQLRRYVHLGTGNYHERTAKQYTDFGLLTCNIDIGRDTQIIFHQLTGLGKTVKLKQLFHSPFTLQKQLLHLINEACALAEKSKKCEIVFKVNGLTDKKIIATLYKASQAGVKIKIIVRTLCCLRPNIPKISENISVTSIVGRFLEHHRVFYFKLNEQEFIYCASADLMERNLYSRIEVMFPILDPRCKQKIKDDIVKNYLKDDKDCWQMAKDATYTQSKNGSYSAQEALLKKYRTDN
jgi:polyphosphate kinase